MVTIHGFAQSTFTRTARLVCEEKGVPSVLTPVDVGSEAHRKLHPFAKVPVLVHGQVLVFETIAIGQYVDAAFRGPGLQPAEPRGRIEVLQWTSAIHDYLYPPAVRRFLAASESPVPEVERAAAGQAVRQVLEVLDRAVGPTGFLVGNRLSLADLSLAPLVAWVEEAFGAGILEGLNGLERASGAMRERPSWRATMASQG